MGCFHLAKTAICLLLMMDLITGEKRKKSFVVMISVKIAHTVAKMKCLGDVEWWSKFNLHNTFIS